MKMDFVIVGVGGQGTLLASRVLGALAGNLNVDCKVSEVHGMSQRGGSVVTYVRMGNDVASPLVDFSGADYVLAFEQLEALRALPYLKQGGTMIANAQRIMPMPVVTGTAQYPDDACAQLKNRDDVIVIDALTLAKEAGETRSVNVVLMGALCAQMQGDPDLWRCSIEQSVPKKVLDVNLKAFDLGYEALKVN